MKQWIRHKNETINICFNPISRTFNCFVYSYFNDSDVISINVPFFGFVINSWYSFSISGELEKLWYSLLLGVWESKIYFDEKWYGKFFSVFGN